MSVFELTNKVAIVTGGGTGIGRIIALEFAKAGADVVVASRKQANVDKVAEEIKALGRDSLAVATDVRVPEQVDNLVKQTLDKFGRIDILVNSAGGSFQRPAEEITPNGWDAIITVNLKGTFLCSQAVGKVMIRQKKGKIINLASRAGVSGIARSVHYGAAKAGVINLTKSLAMAWAPHNINVNTIAPGGTVTEEAKIQLNITPEVMEEEMKQPPPLRRYGQPEDIAYAAIFFASEASDHISGETIQISGAPSPAL